MVRKKPTPRQRTDHKLNYCFTIIENIVTSSLAIYHYTNKSSKKFIASNTSKLKEKGKYRKKILSMRNISFQEMFVEKTQFMKDAKHKNSNENKRTQVCDKYDIFSL